MMPVHCKDVSFKHVDFPLANDSICKQLMGREVFTRTDYFILENGGQYAVVRVEKKRGIGLFREIIGVNVLSLPDSTVFVNDSSCDVLNPHSLVKHAVASKEDTVIVQGMFNHITFISGEKHPRRIRVVDIVPPFPSKTAVLVEEALKTGAVRTPVIIEHVLVDILAQLKDRKDVTVMFPCAAGNLKIGDRPVLYLDKTPAIGKEDQILLAGCQLSRRIFWHTYGYEPGYVDICPRELARKMHSGGDLTIARCCDVHSVKIEGGLALLPYGARVEDCIRAIECLTAPGK